MTAPMSTIEDSFEELDQLEDEFEAVAAATRLAEISSAGGKKHMDQVAKYSPSPKPASKPTTPNGKAIYKMASSGKPSESSPRGSTRKSSSPKAEPEAEKPNLATTTTRKVARPASLAPPKPLRRASKAPTIPTFELPGERIAMELKEKKAARLSMQLDPQKLANVKAAANQRPPSFRSSKPPTIPDFELPGERVARELKEKKAARLSMQVDPRKLAESSPPPQRARSVRSSKPPTVPNFELPGESVSRMKKERLAAKLKAEEEEARQRRQFKARPPPSSVGGSATVRSTFTSRQRESQGGTSDQQSTVSPLGSSPRSGAAKRQSVTMTPSVARTASNASASTAQTNRGRTSSVGSSHFSARATSSSNASVVSASKRSQVSTEEIQEQKARGREIYSRDNSYGQDKERERLERQQAIQMARQKYAEQSRMLAASRRMKQQQSTTAPGAGPN
ncbi:putative carboxylesterase family protein [Diaporthe ampelina]|uniref:Putative carboxylesterase family protein n=1 Tax=Diaporthe ampelina TaxID=1214573 RepID=A0A0G2FVZ1_9PEZI|nr:putative carboxylesterase family protein [Diaporthe ampelina]